MRLLNCLLFLLVGSARLAVAEWTPAFDADNCARRANVVVDGMLDDQGTLKRSGTLKNWRAVPADGVLNIDLDQAHWDALRAVLGKDGPYEVFVFLGQPRPGPGPLPPLWPLIATYPGLVAFDREGGVYLTPDDTTRGLLVKSPDYTKASFEEALTKALNYNDKNEGASFGRQREYDAALVIAAQRGQYDLAKALLAEWADVNACASEKLGMQGAYLAARSPGRPPVTTVVAHCSYEKSNPAFGFLGLLLTKGADPNLADKYGITPLMMADRVGSEEAAAMLKKVGARPFDPQDPKTLAAFVRIDAIFMNSSMSDRDVRITQSSAPYSFEQFQAEHLPQSEWTVTDKVLVNKAVDVLGNPYILYHNSKHDVRINPKTIEALKMAVGAEYWEGYVLGPGDKN